MTYNNKGYKKTTYKKNETTKAVYKPKRGNTDGSGYTVKGYLRFKVNGDD